MGVTVGTPRSSDSDGTVRAPAGPAPVSATSAIPVSPAPAGPRSATAVPVSAIPVSPPPAGPRSVPVAGPASAIPVSPAPAGPRSVPPGAIPGQRGSGPGGYVGRVAPPIPKLPSVPQQRAGRPARTPVARPPARTPRYRYELTDLDAIFTTADERTDRTQQRAYDRAVRRTGWKVMAGALVVVVILTVVIAFSVADVLRGFTSLVP